MKRDMVIIRDILLAIEEQFKDVVLSDFRVKDYDLKTIAYHCNILLEEGLISYHDVLSASDELISCGVGSLTLEGRDYLDNIRIDTVWNNTKATIKEEDNITSK